MGDINRVNIVTLVARENGVCVCEICDTLYLSQPLVSRHLKQLKEANILTVQKEGKWMIYKIHTKPSTLMQTYLTLCKAHEKDLDQLVSCKTRL